MVLYLPPSHLRFGQESKLDITKCGDRIRLFRIKQGLSQKELAERSGLAVSVLARYEQGKILDLNPWILQKVARALKIDPVKLLPAAPKQAKNRDFLSYFYPMDTYGSRLRKLRLNRNLQQKDLAKTIGVTKAAICRYEKDLLNPSTRIISRINEVFKL